MDFTFSAEQDALRDAVRAFLADWSPAHVRTATTSGLGDRRLERALVELGWTGVLVDERLGGLGLGLVDAVVVLEEMGRVAFAGPYLSTLIAGRRGAAGSGSTTLGAAIARGAARHGGARGVRSRRPRRPGPHPGPPHGRPLDAHRGEAGRARRSRRAWVARRGRAPPDGLATFRIDDPDDRAGPDDGRRPARRPPRARRDRAACRSARRATTPRCGGRSPTTPRSRSPRSSPACATRRSRWRWSYAEQRVQFDKPIASHQVIQHKLVDMLHATELGRVGVHYAAWASDTDDADAARAASIAKAQMGEAAVMVTGENIQVHGAVGFTWDSRAGVLYQRAKQNDAARRRTVVAPAARRRPRARRGPDWPTPAKFTTVADAVRTHVHAGDALHVVVGHTRWSAAVREVVRQWWERDPHFTLVMLSLSSLGALFFRGGLVDKVDHRLLGRHVPQLHAEPVVPARATRRARSRSSTGRSSRSRSGSRRRRGVCPRSPPARSPDRRWRPTTASPRCDTPFGRVGLLAPLQADVAILHAPVADRAGNVAVAPPLLEGVWGALGARRGAIVTVERVVDDLRASVGSRAPPRAPGARGVRGRRWARIRAGCSPAICRSTATARTTTSGSRRGPRRARRLRRLDPPLDPRARRPGRVPRTARARPRRRACGPRPTRRSTRRARGEHVPDLDAPPNAWERAATYGARHLADRVQAHGRRTPCSRARASRTSRRGSACRLARDRGRDVQLTAEIGLWGYEPMVGDPFVLNHGNFPTATMLGDAAMVLGGLVGGAGTTHDRVPRRCAGRPRREHQLDADPRRPVPRRAAAAATTSRRSRPRTWSSRRSTPPRTPGRVRLRDVARSRGPGPRHRSRHAREAGRRARAHRGAGRRRHRGRAGGARRSPRAAGSSGSSPTVRELDPPTAAEIAALRGGTRRGGSSAGRTRRYPRRRAGARSIDDGSDVRPHRVASPYLEGPFAPIDTEIDADCDGDRRAARDLAGVFVRNGSNPKYEPPGPVPLVRR